jgi:hypothetical protein
MSASFFFTSTLCAMTMLLGALAFFWTAQGWSPEILWRDAPAVEIELPLAVSPMEGVAYEEQAPDPEEIERDRRIHMIFST